MSQIRYFKKEHRPEWTVYFKTDGQTYTAYGISNEEGIRKILIHEDDARAWDIDQEEITAEEFLNAIMNSELSPDLEATDNV